MIKKILIPILGILSVISFNVQAGVYEVSYTGEELINESSFPIPERQPSLVGTSLYFGPAADGASRWERLMELPILPAGSFSATQTVTVSIVLNMTWVENVSHDNDWDPHIMLGDGSHIVGITVLDQGGADLATGPDLDVIIDANPQPVSYQHGLVPGDWPPPWPELGQPFDLTMVWTLGATTDLYIAYMGKEGFDVSNIALDGSGELSFSFFSDNQLHEEYQINSVSAHVETESLTCNCETPGIFDPPMDQNITVKKGNRVIPLKFTLCDDDGFPITDVEISAPMAEVDFLNNGDGVDFVEEDFLTAGHGDDGNLFVYAGGHWQLNLQTKMFSADGVYRITAVSTDPDYEIFPTCSVDFIIQ